MSTTEQLASPVETEAPMPEVTFDIKMGEKYKSVDFDYEMYRDMVQQIGGSTDELADLKILIGVDLPWGINGTYLDSNIKVRSSGMPNNILAHETQHLVDDKDGRGQRYPAYAAAFGKYLLYGGAATLMANVVNTIVNRGLEMDLVMAQVALGVGSSACYGAYLKSESEERANYTGARYSNWPILKLGPK